MPIPKIVDQVTTATLALCCVTVTALSVRQQFFRPVAPPPARPTEPAKSRPLPPGPALDLSVGSRIGPAGAPLTVVEFADFQCPFCSVSAGMLKEIRAKYPNEIAILYRHMPIPGHEYARAAALASECAGEQGRFEQYYYLLFENYARIGTKSWAEYANKAGVPDPQKFKACLDSEKYASRVDADTAAARRVGVAGTPTWVVGDSVFGGGVSMAQIEQWIARAHEPAASASSNNRGSK